MGISANDLSAPSGDSFKFNTIGDTVEGVIVYVGDFQKSINDFGKERDVARIGIDTGNGEIAYIWPERGSAKAQAIAEALRKAGLPQLDIGQRIKFGYTADKNTGKPQPMKVFSCRLEPGSPADALPDEEPF